MIREEMIWSQKYRPKVVEDCILPESIKSSFREFVAQNKIPNLLLTGSQGCGKTTIAKALCEELDVDYITINCSDDNGIDVLRGKIKNYASSVSLSGGRKVIIMDEADFLNCFASEQNVFVLRDNVISTIPISELENRSETVLSVDALGNLEFDIAYGFQSGEAEVFEVTFDDGSVVMCTKDHPFFDGELNEAKIDIGKELFYINTIKITNLIDANGNKISENNRWKT